MPRFKDYTRRPLRGTRRTQLYAGAASGFLLAGLLSASYLLGGPMPAAGTRPDRLLAFLAANASTQEWSWFLASGPTLVAGPWFLGTLAAHLWRQSPAERYLVAAGFSTGIVAGALLAAASVTWGLFVYLGSQITSPSLILVLAEGRHFAEGSVGFPAAGAIIAFSVAARRRMRGWRCLLAAGLLAGTLQLANGVDDFVVDGVTGSLGPAAFAALVAWVITMSIGLVPEPNPRPKRVNEAPPAAALGTPHTRLRT